MDPKSTEAASSPATVPATRSDADAGADAAPGPGGLVGKRYAERELLGRGGMGEVHLRRDAWLGREIAVKTLSEDRARLATARARFLREARVQGQLEHPSIVPVYDVGVDDHGLEYFTMKRVVGRTLHEVLATGELSRNRLLAIFRQVCLAVDYAHSRGVAHRDLKPANVMIGDFGEVYVLDWGVAKVLGMATVVEEPGAGVDGGTLTGALLGTPGYMAPEQIDAADEVDDRADVYALGAVLFEILAGERLHAGADPAALARSSRQGVIARPSERVPELDVPPELDALCELATRRDPRERTISARDLAQAVERFLEGDRDLAARRTLATKHAELARAAEHEAHGDGAGANAARARALAEAGRALALDPDNVEGADTLVRLIATPPTVLPEEVRDEVDRTDLEAMRLRNRMGLAPLAIFLLVILALPALGEGSWLRVLCILVPLAGAVVATLWVFATRDLTVPRFERRTDVVVALGLSGVAACAVVTTSIIIVPSLALAFAIGAAAAARPDRRMRYVVMGLVAFLVPFVLEWAHAAPLLLPGTAIARTGATIPLAALGLPPLAFRVLVVIATCASIVTPAITVFPVLDAAAALRTQSYLHAWHMRQLATRAPLPVAS